MLVYMIFVLMLAWPLACHARSQMVGCAMSSAPRIYSLAFRAHPQQPVRDRGQNGCWHVAGE